jgi:hypothetical protein
LGFLLGENDQKTPSPLTPEKQKVFGVDGKPVSSKSAR